MTAIESSPSSPAQAPAQGFSLMRMLLELAIVTAMAIGAGALLATLLEPPPPKAEAAAQKDGPDHKRRRQQRLRAAGRRPRGSAADRHQHRNAD